MKTAQLAFSGALYFKPELKVVQFKTDAVYNQLLDFVIDSIPTIVCASLFYQERVWQHSCVALNVGTNY